MHHYIHHNKPLQTIKQQEAPWLYRWAFYTTGHPVEEIGVHGKCLRMWLLSLDFIEPFFERVSLCM